MLIFISYHTPDHDKARAVEAAFAARRPDYEWYFAPRNITGGAWWVPSLGDALARADAALFLAGGHIGPWQELEYYEALRLSRERGGRPRLVPVVTAGQAPGLPFFAQLHQIFAADPAAPEALAAIERAFDESLPPDRAKAWQRFQPYKGLPALEEADAAFFFGRDAETADILDRMARHPDRIIALIGQSGVGKSSLARAGVLARLKSQLWPLDAGQWPAGLRDSRAFLPLVVRPGEQPLKELALAFAQLYAPRTYELDEEAAGWARRFADGSGLHDLLRAARDRLSAALGAEPPNRFVVYLDQGEELYTRAGLDEARRFSAVVAEAAGHEAFSVLLSLRSDYYAAWQNDRALFDAAEHVDVLAPEREVLREIVRRPAETLGAHFESGEMAERVAEATEREPGALPLLSDLLHEMWVNMQARGDGELRWADSPGLVDVAAPLRRRAEAFLADPANDAAIVRRLFTLRLAHVPEIGEPVRRRAHRSECSPAEWAAAEKLAGQDWRLLTLAQAAGGEPLAEVAHEQLLQRWPTLKSWLDDEREFLVWKGQVEHDAAEPDRDLLTGRRLAVARLWFDRRAADLAPATRDFIAASLAAEQRRHRVLVSAISGALIVAVVLASFAGWKWYEADTQTKEAKRQRDRAEHSLELATQTANGLIFDIAQKLQDAAGIPKATIKGILDSARKLQEQLAAGGETSPELQRSQASALGETVATLLDIGDAPGAMAAAQRSRDIFEALLKSAPDSTDYQRELSVSYNKIGDVLVAQGNLPEALKSYRDGLAIADRLGKSDPGNAGWQRDLSVSYDRLGDVLVAQGNLPEALKSYRDGLAIRDRLGKSDPGNAGWQRNLSVSYNKIGDVLVEQGNLPEALKSYRDGLAIFDRLARSDPGNAEWQRNLSVSYEKIGDVLVAQGNLPEALKSYRDGLAIADRLAQSDPGNALWQRDLSVSFNQVGDVMVAQGNLPEALKSYRDGLAIRDRLAQSDPGNALWQRDLSVSHERIGDVSMVQGHLDDALAEYRIELAIMEPLANGDQSNADWQRFVSLVYDRVGNVLVAQGNLPEAMKSYRDGLAIHDRLAQSDPGNAGWQRDLSVSYAKLSVVFMKSGNPTEALNALRQGQAIMVHMARLSPDNAQWKRDLTWFDEQIASLTK